jgi:hypothetical protein
VFRRLLECGSVCSSRVALCCSCFSVIRRALRRSRKKSIFEERAIRSQSPSTFNLFRAIASLPPSLLFITRVHVTLCLSCLSDLTRPSRSFTSPPRVESHTTRHEKTRHIRYIAPHLARLHFVSRRVFIFVFELGRVRLLLRSSEQIVVVFCSLSLSLSLSIDESFASLSSSASL